MAALEVQTRVCTRQLCLNTNSKSIYTSPAVGSQVSNRYLALNTRRVSSASRCENHLVRTYAFLVDKLLFGWFN